MQDKFSDIYIINKENLEIIKSKPNYDQEVVKWIESIIEDSDPIEINLIISDIFFGSRNKKPTIFKPRDLETAPKKNEVRSLNLEENSGSIKTQINCKINKNQNSWKILSYKYENAFNFEQLSENGFNFDFEVIENETHTFEILDQGYYQKDYDLLCRFYNKNGSNMVFKKNFEKKIESPEMFYYKLMKLNFLIYHLIKRFNSQFKEYRIWFSKCFIFKRENEIFYAEKPLKKENKFDADFINFFSHWVLDISNQKLLIEIKQSNILSNFVIHTYNRYFEEFNDAGSAKIEEFKQNQKSYLCDPLKTCNKKINKKCSSIFCNCFSFDEYCKDCQKLILKKDSFKCQNCQKEFTDQPNLYLFKGKTLPKYCKSCSL